MKKIKCNPYAAEQIWKQNLINKIYNEEIPPNLIRAQRNIERAMYRHMWE